MSDCQILQHLCPVQKWVWVLCIRIFPLTFGLMVWVSKCTISSVSRREKVLGLNRRLDPFCEFACRALVCMGFLRVLWFLLALKDIHVKYLEHFFHCTWPMHWSWSPSARESCPTASEQLGWIKSRGQTSAQWSRKWDLIVTLCFQRINLIPPLMFDQCEHLGSKSTSDH